MNPHPWPFEKLYDRNRCQNEKADRYAKENARRRHNFIPFIMQLLQGLAKRDKLEPLIASATERAKARAAANKGKGQQAD